MIVKALADQPVLRYQPAGAFVKDLRDFLKQRAKAQKQRDE